MPVEFDYRDLRDLADDMNRGSSATKAELNDGLREIARLFVPRTGSGPLADETPKRTGKLAKSTRWQIGGTPDSQFVEIDQPAQTPTGDYYGWFVREGTRPHGNHPGTKPNRYHERVFQRLEPEVSRIVERMGTRLLAYMSGDI